MDLSNAFNTILHDELDTRDIRVKDWLSQMYVYVQDDKGRYVERQLRKGVPQGGTFSPLLFCTSLELENIDPQYYVRYADDIAIKLGWDGDGKLAREIFRTLKNKGLFLNPKKTVKIGTNRADIPFARDDDIEYLGKSKTSHKKLFKDMNPAKFRGALNYELSSGLDPELWAKILKHRSRKKQKPLTTTVKNILP